MVPLLTQRQVRLLVPGHFSRPLSLTTPLLPGTKLSLVTGQRASKSENVRRHLRPGDTGRRLNATSTPDPGRPSVCRLRWGPVGDSNADDHASGNVHAEGFLPTGNFNQPTPRQKGIDIVPVSAQQPTSAAETDAFPAHSPAGQSLVVTGLTSRPWRGRDPLWRLPGTAASLPFPASRAAHAPRLGASRLRLQTSRRSSSFSAPRPASRGWEGFLLLRSHLSRWDPPG